MRLAKYLAHAGVASRRTAEQMIAGGRVEVDAELARDPARDVSDANTIKVDGEVIGREPTVVFAVNKPVGVISTASDPQGRPTIVGLVDSERRLYPVGRLDADSSGLVLVTNDGELSNRLTHPRYEVPKTYRVSVTGGRLKRAEISALAGGIQLDDGITAPAKIRELAPGEIEIILREGRNRQVRRMFAALGRDIKALERIKFGPLVLGHLKTGASRRLGASEIESLWQNVGPEDRTK